MRSAELSECDIFPEGSYNWKLCRGETKHTPYKVNAYRQNWGLWPLFPDTVAVSEVTESTVSVTVNGHSVDVHDHEVKYGPGSELLHYYASKEMPDCEDCFSLCRDMNDWGVAGCEARLQIIVEDIFPRAKQWVAENKAWIHAITPGIVEDIGIRFAITSDVKAAIARAKAILDTKQPPPTDVMRIATKKLRPKSKGCSGCGGTRKPSPAMHSRPPRFSNTKHASSVNVYTPSVDLPMVRIVTAIRTAYRERPTLEQTIKSMLRAGFESPVIYAEPNAPHREGSIVAESRLGPFRNFVRMCEDLISRFSNDWLLLCEDDVLFRAGLADFLREATFEKNQAVSFYIAKKQSQGLIGEGFSSVIGDMWGSLAYLIHASQLQKLIDTNSLRNWNRPDRVDLVFSEAATESGTSVLFHSPALAQHIGATSTIMQSRKLTDARVSDFVPDRHQSGLVTLITPTGDRPEAFALCERWVKNQRYTGDIEWIVVDDGKTPTNVAHADLVIRLSPMQNHSLCRNILAAIPRINGDYILVIEDDDYYGPDYVSTMVGRLRHADLVGEFCAKYYYLPQQRWRHRLPQSCKDCFPGENHASLCRTGMTRAVLDTLRDFASGTDNPSIDLRLWQKWNGSRLSWRDERGDSRMCVGIKGSDGRSSRGWKPSFDSVPDTDGSVLRKWVGDDWIHYQRQSSGRTVKHDVTVFTVILNNYDPVKVPIVPGSSKFVCVTDELPVNETDVWDFQKLEVPPEVPERKASRYYKINSHLVGIQSEWSLYIDGNMRLTADPQDVIDACLKLGEADLYLWRHEERDCIYDEAEAVVVHRKESRAVSDKVVDVYRKQGFPEYAGLYFGAVIVRRGDCKAFNETWWNEVAAGSVRDQISLPVAIASSGIKMMAHPPMEWTRYMVRHAHKSNDEIRRDIGVARKFGVLK